MKRTFIATAILTVWSCSALAAPTAQQVVVTNTTAQPVPVTVRNLPPSTDVGSDAYVAILCTNGSLQGCPSPTPSQVALPVGKRFVIEQISGLCTSGGILQVRVHVGASPNHFYWIKIAPPQNGETSEPFILLTRIYADSGNVLGDDLFVQSVSDVTTALCFNIVFTGHLIPMPTS